MTLALATIPIIGGVKAYPGIGRMYLSGYVAGRSPLEDRSKVTLISVMALVIIQKAVSLYTQGTKARNHLVRQENLYLVKMARQFTLRLSNNLKL